MFVRHRKSGVSRIIRSNYGTNTYGQEKGIAGWFQLVKEVRERDGGLCIWCQKPAREVHHIQPLSRGGTNSKANLGCICDECHDSRHPHMHASGKQRKAKPEDPF